MTIHYRQCLREDAEGIITVCHRTGFMGEDLTGTGRFDDRRLFANLFCLYYVYYEPETCFVAVDRGQNDLVVGYILGTADAADYSRRFHRRMMPRIILRLFFYTWWRHRESYREVMQWKRHNPGGVRLPLSRDYQAHLHINILPEYQRRGIGNALMLRFEERLRSLGINGVYLETSNHNTKAVPFYRKIGYTVMYEIPVSFWSEVDDYLVVVMGKKL